MLSEFKAFWDLCYLKLTLIVYRYEQIFVYNLLIHLKCNEVDPDYTPSHGIPANVPVAQTRASKSRTRRSGLNH